VLRATSLAALALGVLIAIDVVLACFLGVFGVRGLAGADGPGEGTLAAVGVGGAAVVLLAAGGSILLWRHHPSSRTHTRSALAFAVALLPACAVVWLVQPDPWTSPPRPEVRCFSPRKREKMGEVGWTVDGNIVVGDRLFPPRPEDFAYVLKGRTLPMDCSNRARCKYRDGSDDDLRALLASLPDCF